MPYLDFGDLRIMGLSMEFLALFGNQILPYLEIEYCLIWKLNIALFESWCFFGSFLYSIYTPYLKIDYCLIWTVMVFLFFLIVSTRLIWKLNIALFEPWCFFGNNFWKYLHALFETQIWPYLKLKYGIFPAISQQFSLAYFPRKFTSKLPSKFLGNPCKFAGKFPSKFLAGGKFLIFFLQILSGKFSRQNSWQIASQISWQKQIPQQIPWDFFLTNFRSKFQGKFPWKFSSQICEQIHHQIPPGKRKFSPAICAANHLANSSANSWQIPSQISGNFPSKFFPKPWTLNSKHSNRH